MPIPLLFAALIAVQPQQRLTQQEYAIDAGHTIVEFSVPFTLSRVRGRFQQVHGTIIYDSLAVERSTVSVVIETKSIDTGWPHRDEHLRTDDFFDVEKYPSITFQSERVERAASGMVVTGPFTMHGVTKRISIPFHLLAPPARSPEAGWMQLYAVGNYRLSRKEFGILGGSTHNAWYTAARDATVGDSVDISIELECYFPDAASQRVPSVVVALERIRQIGVKAQLDTLRLRRGTRTDAEWKPYFTGADFTVRTLIADGRVTEAVAFAAGLTELFPQFANAWILNAYALDCAGDSRAAARSHDKARQLFRPPVRDPNEKFPQVDNDWYYNDQRVRNALEIGRVREAVAMARVVTALYGSTARAHVTLGLALSLAGDVAGARTEYMKALELDPNETRAIAWQQRLKG